MANKVQVQLDPKMDFFSRLLWWMGWNPRPLYVIGAIIAIVGAFVLHSLAGLLLGLVVLIARWKATVLINESTERLLECAESVVNKEGAKRVGVDPNATQCEVMILIPCGAAPFGVRAKPDYALSAVYVCDAFFAIYSGTSFALPDFKLTLATTGDEVYFQHVSAVNYRDSSIEILLSQGRKSKRIPVGSQANATAVLEALRARLRTPQPAKRETATSQAPSAEYLAQARPVNVDAAPESEQRYCYLRFSKLMEYRIYILIIWKNIVNL